MGTISLSNDLSLTPRLKLYLTLYRADLSLSPLSPFLLIKSLSTFLLSKLSLTVPDNDIQIHKFDSKKRKRNDPVAKGFLFIRDIKGLEQDKGILVEKIDGIEINLEGVKFKLNVSVEDDYETMKKGWDEYYAFRNQDSKALEQDKGSLVEKIDGIEINLEGVRFKSSVSVEDDYETLKKGWEEYYAFRNQGNSRGGKKHPDTLVLRGLPSRWFAEPRVSSKPSMLVTHTILSALGKIRNLSVAEDDDFNKNDDEDNIISGLHCKIVVQYETYSDFEASMKGLCGRSLQKEGSRLKADYEVMWDKDGFKNAKTNNSPFVRGSYRGEAPRRQSDFSRYSPDYVRSKRLRD